MRYGLALVTAAAEEPLTATEAKLHCRVDHATDDTLITRLIVAARETAEARTGRQLVTATWNLKLDRFPAAGEPLYVPRAPLASVTHVKYTNSAGTLTTWDAANYIASTAREPGTITPAFGVAWPVSREIADSLEIRFVAGYGAAAAVPGGLKAAMLLMIGHWYANREEVAVGTIATQIPLAAAALLTQFEIGEEFICYGPAA